MYYQTDPRAPEDFRAYACLFSCLLYAREVLRGLPWTIGEAIQAWSVCRGKGYISGDLNGDGDYDDAGEDEIQKYQGIFDELNLPLRYVPPESLGLPMSNAGRILPVTEALDPSRWWVVEAWRWKYVHFVKGYGHGIKPVQYDPIEGGSHSVRYGRCESLRVFEVIV